MTNSNNDIKMVKQQITAKSRKLKASWTVDIETEIMTVMSQDIQYEIDWQVLCEIDPDRKNWIELDFSDTAKKAGRDVIEAWCKETFKHGIRFGAKWQAERMYSEEDLLSAFEAGMMFIGEDKGSFKEWFEQFKKKK